MPGVPPDALNQVKSLFKNIFRRKKKLKATTPQSQKPQPRPSTAQQVYQSNAPTRVPSPQPDSTPEAVTPTDETYWPSPVIDDHRPVSRLEPPTHAPPPAPVLIPAAGRTSRPGTATTNTSAPRELSSSPRSPTNFADEHSAAEPTTTEPSHGTQVTESYDAESVYSDHDVAEPDHVHEESPMEHSDDQDEPLAQRTATPPAAPLTERMEVLEAGPEESQLPPSEETHAVEPQPQPLESEPLPKTEPVAALTETPASVSVQHEETHQANEAARRAPAVYHDEKIPVMAEPPEVRSARPVAPGMVATSGPLEDFPFR